MLTSKCYSYLVAGIILLSTTSLHAQNRYRGMSQCERLAIDTYCDMQLRIFDNYGVDVAIGKYKGSLLISKNGVMIVISDYEGFKLMSQFLSVVPMPVPTAISHMEFSADRGNQRLFAVRSLSSFCAGNPQSTEFLKKQTWHGILDGFFLEKSECLSPEKGKAILKDMRGEPDAVSAQKSLVIFPPIDGRRVILSYLSQASLCLLWQL